MVLDQLDQLDPDTEFLASESNLDDDDDCDDADNQDSNSLDVLQHDFLHNYPKSFSKTPHRRST